MSRRVGSRRVASRHARGSPCQKRMSQDRFFHSLSLSPSISGQAFPLSQGGNRTISNARARHGLTNARDRSRDSKAAAKTFRCRARSPRRFIIRRCRKRARERDVHAPRRSARAVRARVFTCLHCCPYGAARSVQGNRERVLRVSRVVTAPPKNASGARERINIEQHESADRNVVRKPESTSKLSACFATWFSRETAIFLSFSL